MTKDIIEPATCGQWLAVKRAVAKTTALEAVCYWLAGINTWGDTLGLLAAAGVTDAQAEQFIERAKHNLIRAYNRFVESALRGMPGAA
jgi:hypothetical protein